MNPLDTVEIGSTNVRVTRLGLGGAPLGALSGEDGARMAAETVRRGYELGVRFFDTAPLYGRGKSERFYGTALGEFPREGFALSSKVGRVLNPNGGADGALGENPPYDAVFDFSRDGVLRSVEESLERTRLTRLDIALIHDPDDHWEQAIGEAYPALAELRSQGAVGAIGAGMNQWQMQARFAAEGDFDCFLLEGRYTLLDHSALSEFLPLCEAKGIGVILGGPYNSGVLASDLGADTTYFYERTPPEVLARARRAKAVCDRHETPLKAAALQFGLAHPAVAATIPGPRTPAEVEDNLAMAAFAIPPALWAGLKDDGLLPRTRRLPKDNLVSDNDKKNDDKSGDNGKKNGNESDKKNGERRTRVSLWSVTVKYWTLVVWVLAAFLAVWTALFIASYDFSRYTGGDAIITDTPFRAGARFAAGLVFLKDYGLFTIPVLTVAAIALALILDAQENTRMTISRWLRKMADEELRNEGEAVGRDKANKEWDEWLRRMQEAQRDGKPFDEPPPSSR